MRSGVEPGNPATEYLCRQLAPLLIHLIEIRDLDLTPRGGHQGFGNTDHLAIVKINPRDGITRLGVRGFFLKAYHLPGGIKLDDPIALRVADLISKNDGSFCERGALLQQRSHASSI